MNIRVRIAVALTDVAEFLADKAEDILQGTAKAAYAKVDAKRDVQIARAAAVKRRAEELEVQASVKAGIKTFEIDKALAKRPDLQKTYGE